MECPRCHTQNDDHWKFCHNCGQAVSAVLSQEPRVGESDPPAVDATPADPPTQSKCPVRLFVNHGTSLRAGASVHLKCRLENVSSRHLIPQLSIHGSQNVRLHGDHHRPAEVSPGSRSNDLWFEFEIPSEGDGFVTLHVSVDGHDFEGGLDFQVGAAGRGNVTVIGRAGDLTGEHIGDEILNVNLGEANATPAIRPDDFNEVELHRSHGQKAAHGRPNLRPESRTNRLSLVIRLPDQPERNVCLFAQPTVRLGRERDKTDLRIRLTKETDPSDDPENTLLGLISSEHADITFSGQRVQWSDISTNGTRINGTLYNQQQAVPLPQRAMISLADVVTLNFRMYTSDSFNSRSYEPLAHLMGGQARPTNCSHKAIRLRRDDDLATVEEYIILQQVALIGRGPRCAIQIDHPTVQHSHARLLHLAGWFWIEPVSAGTSVVIDGEPVSTDHLAQLTPDTGIRIGDVEIAIDEFWQHILDCECHT